MRVAVPPPARLERRSVGTELLRELALMRVTDTGDDADVGHVATQAGDGCEPHRAGAEHGDDRRRRDVLAGSDGRCGEERGVDAARERLDEDFPGTVVGPMKPVDVANLERVRTVPYLLAGLLGAMALLEAGLL